MSHATTSDHPAVLVRAEDAELIGFPPQTVRLLADSPPLAGASAPSASPFRAAPMAPIPTTTPRRPSCSMFSAAQLSYWPVIASFLQAKETSPLVPPGCRTRSRPHRTQMRIC